MVKFIKLSFTGVACLGPAYQSAAEVDGPLYAVMPNSQRARFGSDEETQIHSHVVFASFPAVHLDPPLTGQDKKRRRSDYDFIDSNKKKWALCVFEREALAFDPPPVNPKNESQEDERIRYNVTGENTGIPQKGHTHVDWIARWSRFAAGGEARFRADVLDKPGQFVRLRVPGCDVSAEFICPNSPLVKFLYGDELKGYFSHATVVTLAFKDETKTVTLRSTPFDADPPYGRPKDLVLRWGSADVIPITIGNASLEEVDAVLRSNCGRQHEGRKDYEFEIIYDVVYCKADNEGRHPLPEVLTNETRPVPCLTSMVDMG